MDFKIIAVDFDGTLCENKWPEIGAPNNELIAYLKEQKTTGAKLILWTCRVGEILENAVKWCAEQGLIFDAVNENLPEVLEWMGGDSRKIFADEYIDDRNFGFRQGGRISEDMSQSERMELWGCLIDVVEDWLVEKGITVEDIPNVEREDVEDAAIIFGDDYDYLADRFAEVIGISRDFNADKLEESKEKSSLLTWAEREIEIACKYERGDRPKEEWDYGCACYESALKAFKSLEEDGHSGFSIGLTKQILNRLIDGNPLTPIEDTDDIWNDIADVSGDNGEVINYQCKRKSSLFKYVYADGSVEFRDVDRFIMVDTITDTTWHSGLVDQILGEKYPITMPYIPADKPYKAICEEYLTDRKNGDFDTVGILKVIEPDGTTAEINRYFKDVPNGWEEISLEEFKSRRAMHYERVNKERREIENGEQ